MSEMVERVASRIQESLMDIACGESDSPVYDYIARAAIKAMREPTEGMLKAAHIKMQGEAIKPGCYWSGMAQRWRQMIDEALR
jgi:hypothetical protein